MNVRKTFFWLHLGSGLAAGIIVAIMSFTGIVIAFEHEILEFIDRDVKTVLPDGRQPLPLEDLQSRLAEQRPEFKPTTILVPRADDEAYEFRAGRSGGLYVDPYTAEVREPASTAAHDFLHIFEDWHRWLGMEGEGRETGKLITGVANFAFLFMCLSGIYLWWPRKWNRKFLKPVTMFNPKLRGSAKHFNWHHVFGSWSVIVLTVLTATAVVFSFGWAHRLVFALAGEEAPASRGPGMLAGPAVVVPEPSAGMSPLPRDQILANVQQRFPEWEAIGIDLPAADAAATAPLGVVVFEPAAFQTRGRTQLSIDPYRGDVLHKIGFEDRSAGTQARIWIRFLHTGEAFGFPGKLIATLATAASLFLVYTGFMLSWRRFFGRKRAPAAVAEGA